jgi:hypothetical protein
MSARRWARQLGWLCAFLAAGCDKDPGDLFDPNRVIEVEIEMDPADFETLRSQNRSIMDILAGECLAEPFERPFTFFPADVTVEGVRVRNVGIRKKGFLGSLDVEKPSLKIDFEEFVQGQQLGKLEKMVLNNCKQDPSFVRQCVTYKLFTAAGLPAPRCNFAHVTLNGEDLGLFVHLESIDKDLVEDFFPDATGNLYEGTISDFRTGFTGTFEKETNEELADFSDITALLSTLEAAPDAELRAQVEAQVNLDAYLSFWAMEVLTNHVDGYSNNTNNFYMYNDPTTGGFHFIVSGTDGSLLASNFAPAGEGAPLSVFATGILSRRLYLLPETQALYLARLDELLNTVWNEQEILAEIDRLEALIGPFAAREKGDAFAAGLAEVRAVVSGRRGALTAELASGPPPWPFDLRAEICLATLGQMEGTFSTSFGTVGAPNPFLTGTGTLIAELNGAPFEVAAPLGANSGFDPNAAPGSRAVVQLVGQRPDGTLGLVFLSVDPAQFRAGQTLEVDLFSTVAILASFDPATNAFTILGLLHGAITFDEAGTSDGDAVSGSFAGELVRSPF